MSIRIARSTASAGREVVEIYLNDHALTRLAPSPVPRAMLDPFSLPIYALAMRHCRPESEVDDSVKDVYPTQLPAE